MSDIELEVVDRWQRGQSLRGIARDLGIGRERVANILRRRERDREQGPPHPELPAKPAPRSSQLDAFSQQIDQLLARHPNITATRVFEELRQSGYKGGYTIVRDRVRQLRPRAKAAPVVRFESPPGRQAQMDYSVYDIDFAVEGRRRVNLFSYVLGYSRRQYIRFTESQDFETTLREHARAFEHLGGVAATCLYDNMKVVVDRWTNDHPVYNTRFLAFAVHYGFRPVACRPRRPQTKGKVERPFQYVETSLLNGREFRSLEHLNEVARWWLAQVADVRQHRVTGKRPIDAHAEESPLLLPLPASHYDTAKVVYRLASPEGHVDYRQNAYSVPWQLRDQLLPIRVTEDRLIVYDRKLNVVAEHPLFHAQVAGRRRQAPEHRPPKNERVRLEWIQEQFAELGEAGGRFLPRLLAKQRYGRQQATRILELRRFYRRQDLIRALDRADRYHAHSAEAVERILAARATPQAPWEHLSEDQRETLRELSGASPVEPRPTSEYQHLLFGDPTSESESHEDEPQQRNCDDSTTDPGPSGDAPTSPGS